MENIILEFKWTVSRGRNTYGYNICTLYANGKKVSKCNGGGYDMEGVCLAMFISLKFAGKFRTVSKPIKGLRFIDPSYDPLVEISEGSTIGERKKNGMSLGLEEYQAIHRHMSDMPDEKHTIPYIDGAAGFNEVRKILLHFDLKIERKEKNSINTNSYILSIKE